MQIDATTITFMAVTAALVMAFLTVGMAAGGAWLFVRAIGRLNAAHRATCEALITRAVAGREAAITDLLEFDSLEPQTDMLYAPPTVSAPSFPPEFDDDDEFLAAARAVDEAG